MIVSATGAIAGGQPAADAAERRGPRLALATGSYRYLQQEFCAAAGFEPGTVETQHFPDGERYLRIACDVSGRDVVLLGGTISDGDTLELYDLACAIAKYGARRLTLMIPYFGYSTMERATRPGEVVVAKTRARLFSAIPPAAAGNRVLLLDVHSEGLPHYFEGEIRASHVYAKPLILAAARRLGGADFVLACTDAGRAKWVESLANDLGVHAAFVFKKRLDGDRTEITGVSAEVRGKPVIIYDDMIRTGGSLRQAAAAYRAAGATRVAAIATHGLLPGDALAKLQASGLFERIVCTNSHPRAVELRSAFLEVESVAGLLAAHV